jgi:hypothetical protein
MPFQEEEMAEFSKQSYSWKTIVEPLTGNVIISEVEAPTYVVLRNAEKQVHYGELVGITKCVTL